MNPNLSPVFTASLVSLAFLAVFFLGLAILWWLLIGRTQPQPRKVRPANAVISPSAGIVLSISVHPGDRVAFGQELCVFQKGDAKQAIRAARPGEIGSVAVAAGDPIARGQVIIEYRIQPKAEPDEPDASVD